MEEEFKYKEVKPADILRYDRRSKNYFYTGNIIANALEIPGYTENQIFDDLFTIAGEDAIRENFGYYFYDREFSEVTKITEQLERGFEPDNPQIPYYEWPRNFQNYLNNMNLVKAREDSNSPFHSLPFIEVSPPPSTDDVLLQEDIKQRGYTEYSYLLISIPMIDEKGTKHERAVQLWVNNIDEKKWHELFDGLANEAIEQAGEDYDQLTSEVAGFSNAFLGEQIRYGADVIARGGFLDERQLNYLHEFLIENQIEAKFDDLESVATLKNEFKEVMKRRFSESLEKIIAKASGINSFDEIEEDLYNISNKIISLHNEIKLYIRDLFDKPLAHDDYSQSYATYSTLSDEQRYQIVQQNGFDIKFCGGKIGSTNTMLGGMLGLRQEKSLGMRIFGERSNKTPDLSEPCDGCGARWWVKEGDSETYQTFCPGCGNNVFC